MAAHVLMGVVSRSVHRVNLFQRIHCCHQSGAYKIVCLDANPFGEITKNEIHAECQSVGGTLLEIPTDFPAALLEC